MFEHSRDAIGVGIFGQQILVNPAYVAMFGCDSDAQCVGRPITDFIAPSSRARITELTVLRSKGLPVPSRYETRGMRADGTEFDLEVQSTTYEMGGERYTLAVLRDITDRKERDDSLRHYAEALERMGVFERTISEIAASLVSVPTQDIAAHVDDAQRRICEILDVDMSSVWERDPIGDRFTLTHIYRRLPGPIIPKMMRSDEYFPWCAEQLGADQIVVVDSTRSDPPAGVRDRESWEHFGVKSALILPLFGQGHQVVGTISLDRMCHEERWEPEIVDRLRLCAEIFSNALSRQRVESALVERDRRLRDAARQTVAALAGALEARDPYTSGHQRRVSHICAMISRVLDLPEQQIEGIEFGALIHDIGKLYVPMEILNRPGKLTDIEFDLVKTHAQVGYDIVRAIDFPWPVAEMVLQHHERLDGSGYPQGLRADEITYEAKILAVADVLEAITSHRPYREAVGVDAAMAEIRSGRGTRFDEEITDVCIDLVKTGHYPVQL